MNLPYPIDSPGYVVIPGTANNYLTVPDHAALDLAGNFEFVLRVAATNWATGAQQAFCAKMSSYGFACNTGANLVGVFYFTDAPSTPIFASSSAHTLVNGTTYWLKMTRVQASGLTSFFWAADSTTEPTVWTALGTATVAAGKALVNSANAFYFGCLAPSSWMFAGRIYTVILRSGSTVVLHFNADDDLAGVPSDAATFVPTVPESQLVTVTRKAAAADQGYVAFPGTLGNYLQAADIAALDIIGALTVVWRERARDLTPTRLGQSVLSKAATASQFSYRVTHGPQSLVLERSANGTAVTLSHVGNTQPPFVLDYLDRWLWFCLTFDTVPALATTRLWYSEANSLTPPPVAQWLPVAAGTTVTDAAAKTIFSGSSPLLIGAGTSTAPSFDGDIGYLSLRSGGSNVALGGTEVWRLDAENLVGIDPATASITPSVGGIATVVRAATPKDTGFIEFPGTPGNYLSYPEVVGDFTDTLSFVVKIARDNWRPGEVEAIVAKWGVAGQRSYIWQLNPSGTLTFRYTTNGTAEYSLTSPVVSDPGEGVPLWIGISVRRSTNSRLADFWYSSDAVDWTQLGTTQTVDQGSTSVIFNSTTPLLIGSATVITAAVEEVSTFTGRILEIAGSDGVDGFFGSYTSVVERFRIGPEHLEISAAASSFPAIGGTVTVARNAYPVDFGVWQFPGTKSNYLQVPDAANLRITDNLVAEVRIAPEDWTPQEPDRVLLRKMGVSGNYGWEFSLTALGTLKLRWSTNGTAIVTAESTLSVPLQDRFSKRVAFSYKSSDRLRFWTSDDGITWARLGDEISPSGTIFPTTGLVQIGVTYWGSMTNASIRQGVAVNGAPLLDTEVLLIDQGCLNINPHPATFTATTGQTVTVFTDDVSLNDATQGWIDLPGTLGNYLSTPDHADLDFTGSMTVIIRFAPNDWTTTTTLISKWSATAGNYSWMLQMLPSKEFRFAWTSDGTTVTTLDSPPVATYVDGEFRMLAITVEMATTKTLRIWESTDFGSSWILRSSASTLFGAATIHSGSAPLIIGAQNNTEHFNGRISYLDMRNGIGTGGAPGGTRALWWTAESLHLSSAVASFVEETGKTITINKANTPTTSGQVNFYGQVGDYARATVPTLASTAGMTLVTRVDLSETRASNDYLVAGAASPSPDFAIISDVFISAYVTLAEGATDQYLAAAWWPQTEVSWRLYIDRYSGGLRFVWSVDGINPSWTEPVDLATSVELAALGTGLVFLGVQIERNYLGTSLFTMMTSLDNGATWTPFGTQKQGPQMDDTWAGDPLLANNVRLTIGGAQTQDLDRAADTDTVTDASWLGRIQWVQMTEYPSDVLVWRFDPTEYPGTGLEWSAAVGVGGTIGNTAIGASSGTTTTALNCQGFLLSSGLTYTASTGDIVTQVAVYGSGTGQAQVAVYTVDDVSGSPDLLVGSPVTISVGATAGWYTTTCSIPLNHGVRYTLGWDFWIDEDWTYRYDTPGGNRVSNHDGPELLAIWDQLSLGTTRPSWYATVTPPQRAWRLDSTEAITQLPPPNQPAEQVVVQRWDNTVDCSFSLSCIEDGFSFKFSEDGTPNTGGSVDIAIDADTWHPSEDEGNWGWLAITLRFEEDEAEVVNGLIRIFHAEDTGTGKVPTMWGEIDAEITAPDIAAMFVDTTELVTFGGGADGLLPFVGSISHLSLRDGTGTAGVVGGTERFRVDMTSLYGILADADTFPAGTAQTVSMIPSTANRLADITPTPSGRPSLLEPSPPGPTLYLDPAPPGPELEISPSTDGPELEIVPSPPGPALELISPSLDRSWWPGSTTFPDDPTKWWTQPAFTVQRQLPAAAGDYVRGSSNVLTEQTAVRFPRSVFEGWSAEGVGKGILYAAPHPDAPYDTVKIEWNLPADLTVKGRAVTPSNVSLDPWLQVAIVRSSFGSPTTVNDGQTIYLTTKSLLFPSGQYPLEDENIITPDVFDPRVPSASDDERVPRLPGGRWYYYTLFFLLGQQWVKAASDTVLIPRDHHHAEHLWNGLPPYYRWLDEQQGGGRSPGHLQKFLTVFGYDFDLTRELVESWANVYHTDFTPMSLLRRVGENFGIPYESTIGDIRYRALVAKVGFLYHGRGTTGTLRRYVSAASKCDCDVTVSQNVLLLPDDSDFYAGTGNWAGLHPDTLISGSGIPGTRLTPDKIRLDHGTRDRPSVPAEQGRGSMHLWSSKADATTSLIITCGDGQRYVYDTGEPGDTDRTNDILVPPGLPTDMIPRFHGVYVKPDQVLSFSFTARADPEAVNTVVEGVLMFFDKEGQPNDLVDHEINNTPISLSNANTWYPVFVDGAVPITAVYCVPGIIVTSRPAGTHATLSPMVHFAGAALILQGTVLSVSSTDPDVLYLTLDYPGELIGTEGGGLPQAFVLGEES